MSEAAAIHVGPAGWSYQDWVGPVYPPGRKVDELLTIARWFDCIELNSSFYRVPSPRTVRSWADRTAGRPGFTFTVKAPQRFTHEAAGSAAEARDFLRVFDPLLDRGAVGAFLLQFPWSFKDGDDARRRVAELAAWFRGVPTAIELRHASWNTEGTRELLRREGLAICDIDQPIIGPAMPPEDAVTNDRLGYVRLHGRNYRNWARRDAGRDERYDYLYGDRELDEWKERALRIASRVKDLYIITNNHFRGQALVNAFQMRHLLGQPVVEIPDSLVGAYPVLGAIAPKRFPTGLFEDESA